MPDDLIIIGAGGFGRETADVVDAINARSVDWRLLGVADDSPSPENLSRLAARGIAYLGTTDDVVRSPERPRYVVGVGAPQIRRLVADRMDTAGFPAATLVHPEANVGSRCHLGEGTVVLAGARLTTNIRLGRHVHINPNATIGHDSLLEDFVSMNPGSAVSGDCIIGSEVLIGVGAVVLNRLTVGQGAVVGGGACVVREVSPGDTVVGVPAKSLRGKVAR